MGKVETNGESIEVGTYPLKKCAKGLNLRGVETNPSSTVDWANSQSNIQMQEIKLLDLLILASQKLHFKDSLEAYLRNFKILVSL